MTTKEKVKKPNVLLRYLRETQAELKRVNWPTREETVRLTQLVLVVTIGMALFLWLMDVVFSWWLGGILISDPWRIGLAVALFAVLAVVAIILGRQSQ